MCHLHLKFIADESPKKHGHPKIPEIVVEVCALEDRKNAVRRIAEQDGFDPGKQIKGCPSRIPEGAVGVIYRLPVKRSSEEIGGGPTLDLPQVAIRAGGIGVSDRDDRIAFMD
jgi:hypothetical protein